MRRIWVAVAVCVVAGCSSPPPTRPAPKEDFPPPDVTVEKKNPLYEQLHSGLFQADPAVKKIADAEDLARDVMGRVTPDMVEPLKDMAGTLDDCGSSLADLTGDDPPTEEQVKANETKYTQKRADLVNQIDDILHDLREQEGVAADLAENGQADLKPKFAKIDDLLNSAIDDLVGALRALGGKDEGSQTEGGSLTTG